ncbi:AraC family transcriptional regulator [Aquimarina macrocephali]|uniref:AraC family transcriptional regulator n=1 Tax=Aquimarina macrocephali TaxID=666563 RepID=UPI000467037F|nr:AraC family transcriptional regulator [Aquimarina macrocephali]
MSTKKTYLFFTFFYKRITIVFLLYCIQITTGQEEDFVIPDSLKTLDYDSIYKIHMKTYRDTLISKTYLYTYLKKAISENNTLEMAKAYSWLFYYAEEESEKIRLIDRSIALSKNLEGNITIKGYSFKGGYYLNNGQYTLALDNYLQALALAEKENSTEYISITEHNIACIKTEIGKHQEALPLFKENFTHIITKHATDTVRYLNSIIPLAESYRYNNLLDSASVYHYKAIKRSQKPEHYYNRFYGRVIINEGINLFYKEKFKNAYDSIAKGIPILDKTRSENRKAYILGEFYLGKLQLLKQDAIAAKKHFLTVDSILQKEKITPLEIRESYEFMINFYKTNHKKEKQLEYINKLLQFDSIVNQEASFVSSRLFKEFDTPLLLKEKETLINELKGNNKNLNLLVVFLSLLTLVAIAFLYRQYQKRKTYQEKFEQLIAEDKLAQTIQRKQQSDSDIGVADDIVEEILNKLVLFEQNHHYLKKNISTTSLAKDIKTNTKYLSKVINHHKQKNFANYINDLRIAHAVTQLKENKTLKHYTIQGIAEEMGFNTAESFSSAFKKSTGIKTSYFIKKLHDLDTM